MVLNVLQKLSDILTFLTKSPVTQKVIHRHIQSVGRFRELAQASTKLNTKSTTMKSRKAASLPTHLHRYRFTYLSIFIFTVLVPSFLITLRSPRLEPYPALVLPSGAYLSSKGPDANFSYTTTELWAKKTNSVDYVQLNLANVFPYFDATRISVMLRRGLQLGPEFSDADNQQTRNWLGKRLAAAGYETDTVLIQRRKVGINPIDGSQSNIEVLLNQAIELH